MLKFLNILEVAKYLLHACFFLREKLIKQLRVSQVSSLFKKCYVGL